MLFQCLFTSTSVAPAGSLGLAPTGLHRTTNRIKPSGLVCLLAVLLTGCAQAPGSLDTVLAAHRDAHYEDCLAGLRCNQALLSSERRERVRATVARLNLDACLRGEGSCQRTTLSEDERVRVARAAEERNLEYCLSGLTACDPVPLTEDQRRRVQAAALRRNYMACMNSVGTFLACDLDALSPEQREHVRQRNLAANEYVCMNALMGCIEELLTPEQRARYAALPPGAFR